MSKFNALDIARSYRKCLAIVVAATFLTGCASMGTRIVEIEATEEKCYAKYESGTEISKGFEGKMILSLNEDGSCLATIDGSGGAVDPTEGHRATVDTVKESGKIVGEITEGAVRGFAP